TPTVAPTPVSIPVSTITISGVSPVTVGHFIQLNQAVVPAEATNQSIVWSIENGTGTAIISAGGLLTGISAGMVTVKAAAADGSGVYGTTAIEIVASSSDSGGAPAATPSTSPSATPTAAPSPTASAAPAAGGGAKFANNVVQLETVLSGFNQKVELANANPSPVSFTDISTHWADLTVETFVKLGIVQGYEDGGFHPDAGMTRAEFAAVIARVFELPGSGSRGTLSDISGHWAEAAISSLQEKGLVSGYQNGTFKPNAEISRAEIIAVIAKIVDMSGVDVPAAATFQDIGNTWNQDEIRQAAAAGIISGAGSGEFLPAKQASRAEALTIVLHVLQL
ncbi:S-layer homology domain-containing protein, partial [Paenibacillus ihuae]|uniref:S-layer homology domain-containing protein n=1 Tax=Paenibacillus ihuae TaxID=1232431 RepID=UPI001652423A